METFIRSTPEANSAIKNQISQRFEYRLKRPTDRIRGDLSFRKNYFSAYGCIYKEKASRKEKPF